MRLLIRYFNSGPGAANSFLFPTVAALTAVEKDSEAEFTRQKIG